MFVLSKRVAVTCSEEFLVFLVTMTKLTLALIAFLTIPLLAANAEEKPADTRSRASDLGLKVGVLPSGPLNTITDVVGVEGGHTTINRGNEIHTGVTAVLPHPGNLYREKVPGAVFVGNGFGKLTGSTQVDEMGEIETPILLTSTTSVPRVADALISYTVGVLVQTNFGGVLTIAGAPVGQELGQYYLREELQEHGTGIDRANGSVMVIVATDAPLDARNLKRLGARALLGVTRTGSAASNGSGDYAIAFSTAAEVRIRPEDKALTHHVELLTNDAIS